MRVFILYWYYLKAHVLGTWGNLINLQNLCVKEQETRHSQGKKFHNQRCKKKCEKKEQYGNLVL